ncbi:MAG: hypothetical protein F4Y45_18080 [Acidobacteria bacterium]|nr:hypothetical protein [Acidobacteriota bacterium]MYD72604.1 hypothetical protein [Acidobacteriota bacterium]
MNNDRRPLEELLKILRRMRAQLAVSLMQRASLAAGTDRLTRDEINTEIDAAREARRQRPAGDAYKA